MIADSAISHSVLTGRHRRCGFGSPIISSSQGYYKLIADTPALLKNPDSPVEVAKEGEDERGKERLTDCDDVTIARSDDQIDHSGRGCLPLLLLVLLVLLVLFAPAR